jgi:hypothetical protein
MLCVIAVETWDPGAIYPVATVLLGSTILGQTALFIALRAKAAKR